MRTHLTLCFARLVDWATDRLSAVESTYLGHRVSRQVVKGALDFHCGVAAVLVATALQEPDAVLTAPTLQTAIAVGAFLVLGHAAAGSYRAIWRYTGFPDALVSCGAALVALASLAMGRLLGFGTGVPHDTLLLAMLLALFGAVGLRGLRRWQATVTRRHRARTPRHTPAPTRPVLIVGATERGVSIGREILEDGIGGVRLAGYVDDDPGKIGGLLNGVPVLGPLADLLSIADRYRVSEVIVAMPEADAARVRALARSAEDAGLRVRAIHTVDQLVKGRAVHRPGNATVFDLLGPGAASDGKPDGANGTGSNGNGSNGRPVAASDAARDARPILVTGGAGFVGSHLVRLLLDCGYRVRVLDRFDYGRSGLEPVLAHPRFEAITGDICNSRDLSRAARGVDSVIALAAVVGDPACNLYPEETINLNYTATKILVETCNFYGVRRLLFASSCSVYGASTNGDWLTERSRLHPLSLYARTRVLSENILFDRCGDVEPVVLRLSTVFGLSARMRFDLVVNTLTARAIVDRRITIHGGNQWRPNVHCRDVARAFLLALEAPRSVVAGEVFNVGADHLNHTISELGEIVASVVDGGVEVARDGDVPDPRDYKVKCAKIRTALGFEPTYNVAQGVEEIVEAMRATPELRHYKDPIYHNVQAFKRSVVAPRRRRSDAGRTQSLVPA